MTAKSRVRLRSLTSFSCATCAALAVLVCATAGDAFAQLLNRLGPLGPLGEDRVVTYFIDDGEPGSSYRESDRELARWALQSWERETAGRLVFVPADEEASALVRVHFVPASAGQYGEMRALRVDGRRGAAVYIRPDTEALGADIARRARDDELFRDAVVFLTCLHELGHALGLVHTAEYADIMYFFGLGGDIEAFFGRFRDQLGERTDITRTPGVSEGDRAQLRALYP